MAVSEQEQGNERATEQRKTNLREDPWTKRKKRLYMEEEEK